MAPAQEAAGRSKLNLYCRLPMMMRRCPWRWVGCAVSRCYVAGFYLLLSGSFLFFPFYPLFSISLRFNLVVNAIGIRSITSHTISSRSSITNFPSRRHAPLDIWWSLYEDISAAAVHCSRLVRRSPCTRLVAVHSDFGFRTVDVSITSSECTSLSTRYIMNENDNE